MYWIDRYLDPRWLQRREEILFRDGYICQRCGDQASQVHHLKYITGHELWEYTDEDLLSLCPDCHEIESSLSVWLKYEKRKWHQYFGYRKIRKPSPFSINLNEAIRFSVLFDQGFM